MKLGDYEGLIRSIETQERGLDPLDLLSEVMLEYEKAVYLEKLNDLKGTRRSLELVVTQGNKLNYVARAEKWLGELGRREP